MQSTLDYAEIVKHLNDTLAEAVKGIWPSTENENVLAKLKHARACIVKQLTEQPAIPSVSIATESRLLNDLCDCGLDEIRYDAVSAIIQAAANWHEPEPVSQMFLLSAKSLLEQLIDDCEAQAA